MDFDSILNQVARTIVDMWDVDLQQWMGRTLAKLRETPTGSSFADWAQANPFMFESLLRVTSAAVRRLPNDDNLIIETVYTQLSRLPVEVKRAVDSGTPQFVSRQGNNDKEFLDRYEEAVKDLSDEDLAKVVRLDAQRLRQWVDSPSRIRPHLMKKWVDQDSEKREKSERGRSELDEFVGNLRGKIQATTEKLRKVNDQLEVRRRDLK